MIRRAFKRAALALGWLLALPHRVRYAVARRAVGDEIAFRAASERLALRPGQLGVYVRQAFYRASLQHCGRDVYFGFMTVLSKPDARIGDNVYLGRFCCVGLCDIGGHTKIADGVQLLSGRHHHAAHDDEAEDAVIYRRMKLGRHAWIGANAVIMADVGDQAVVGAGAVVVKPVPDADRVVGVPAESMRRVRSLAA